MLKRPLYYYEGEAERSFGSTFVIVGKDWKSDCGVTLILREDRWDDSELEGRDRSDVVAGGKQQWASYTMSLEEAIKFVVSHNEKRGKANAPLSEEYVRRFGEKGKKCWSPVITCDHGGLSLPSDLGVV